MTPHCGVAANLGRSVYATTSGPYGEQAPLRALIGLHAEFLATHKAAVMEDDAARVHKE
jgi:hypothetical protein